MAVYCCSCIASMLVAFLGLRRFPEAKNRIGVIIFSAIPMILVAALRYDVGTDYLYTYVSYFDTLKDGFTQDYSRMEILYHLMNVITVKLGWDYVWLFAVSAVIFYVAAYSQIFRDSPYPTLSIFLMVGMGYVFVFFNAMRQMVGCAILMYALRYVEQRKFRRFILCVAIASGFHISCAIFGIIYWVSRIKITPIWAFILTAVVGVLGVFISNIIHNIVMTTKYALYIGSEFDTGETAYVMLTINFLILVLASILYRRNPKYQTYYNLQLLAVWVTMFSGKVVLMLRLLWMFGLPGVISLPMILHEIEDDKNRRLIISIVCLLYTFYFILTVGINNSNGVLPYRTIFSR